jgi:ribosome-binding factor A
MAEKIDRLTRVNELLKREVANYLERGLINAPGMLVSVTEVRSSVDLRNATVEVSIFGGTSADKRHVMEQLEELRSDIQKKLARSLAFKHTPVLCFRQDFRIEQGDRVFNMLNSADDEPKGDE